MMVGVRFGWQLVFGMVWDLIAISKLAEQYEGLADGLIVTLKFTLENGFEYPYI